MKVAPGLVRRPETARTGAFGIFYGHVTFLKENGIYILETMNTGPLVAQSVKEFMFVLGQARIKGAVQMIINPVALW